MCNIFVTQNTNFKPQIETAPSSDNFETIKKQLIFTGLDPAGPIFKGNSPESKLQPEDAKLVEVLHSRATDSRPKLGFALGILENVGTRDIYVNGGWQHPYCDQNYIKSPCSHMIPIHLLISINNNEMVDCIAKWKCKGEDDGIPFSPIVLRDIKSASQTQELIDAGCSIINNNELVEIGRLDLDSENDRQEGQRSV